MRIEESGLTQKEPLVEVRPERGFFVAIAARNQAQSEYSQDRQQGAAWKGADRTAEQAPGSRMETAVTAYTGVQVSCS